jgi:leucyl/phenylalanyl-tRNA--protein transferase
MPAYRLIEQLVFPPPAFAEPVGLVAVGGDLSTRRLLLAYSSGIFPWFNEDDPILWWSPDPRCVLEPRGIHLSHSLGKVLRRGEFLVTFDQDFAGVIDACAAVRCERGEGTWLIPAMRDAYLELHQRGYAHSVECWQEGDLVGGLYGVGLGRCFFGESMFHRRANASKAALAVLCRALAEREFELIDCQIANPHLLRLGAREIPREEFLARLLRAGVTPSTMPPPGPFPAGELREFPVAKAIRERTRMKTPWE